MSHPTPRPIISARNLSVALPGDNGSETAVLNGVSLDVWPGEVVDVVGPSGSGKTTLLRALSRLLPAMHGELRLRAAPSTEYPPEVWRSRVALLPQKPALVPGTVRDNLTLPWGLKIRKGEQAPDDLRMRQVLDELGLSDVALDRTATRLSVGQEARLAFARVWLTAPDVLLLDEADAALDADSSAAMSQAVRRIAQGLDVAGCPSDAGVVRVRHREPDGVASRRLRLADGALEEVTT